MSDVGYRPGPGTSSTAVDTAIAAVSAKKPLVVDGTRLREGAAGPYFKATGYNATFLPNIYTAAQTLSTTAKIDTYFAQLRPNSLTRMRAYAPPVASGISWATQLATLDAVVASARKFGQRIIMCFTTWSSIDATADAYGGKSATWFTSQTYKHSVTGALSYEDWVTAVVSRYASDGTVCIYDLLNEPQDGGGNSASAASFVTYMSGVIKAIDPGALVYMGIDLVGSVGGAAAYETINAGADLCSSHWYNSYGFVTADTTVAFARTLSKPIIFDETGVYGKGYYGSSGDSDKDDIGWPAVTYEAQGRLLERQMSVMLSLTDCVAALCYAYTDWTSGGGWLDGLGHYDPPDESLGRKVIRSLDLNGDGFSIDTLTNLPGGSWFDGAQGYRYAPGAAMTTVEERAATVAISPTAATAPTAGRWNNAGTFQFNGSQFFLSGRWKVLNQSSTQFFAVVPTALPGVGAFSYLTSPQTVAAGAAVRINALGKVELLTYASATGGTIKGTSSNAVTLNAPNVIAVAWNATSGAFALYVNGVKTTGTATATLAGANATIGAAQDGTNGFIGHLLEGMYEPALETDANIARTLAYLGRKYQVSAGPGVSGSLDDILRTGLGFTSWNYSPLGFTVTGNRSLATGVPLALAVPYKAGQVVRQIAFSLVTAAAGTACTYMGVGIANSAGLLLGSSANLNTAASWSAVGLLPQALSSAYVIPEDGNYYHLLLLVGAFGTTQPQFNSSSLLGSTWGTAVIYGQAGSGLTTLGTPGTTVLTIAGTGTVYPLWTAS